MEKLLERFGKFKLRERLLLIIAIIVLFYLGIDKVAITPFFKSIHEINDRLETQRKLLKKYHLFAINKKKYEARLSELEQYYANLEGKFLTEETEELASAKLQEMVNNLAKKNGLVVARSTALKKEVLYKKPYLVALSINIEINDMDGTQKLQNFLYDIEYNSDKLLFIDNLKIKTLGMDVIKGATVSSTLTAIASIGKKQ
ncbi:MAG: General secretion pathway protein [Candidatus Brocadiaceae bacterium]|nr:General secretion pathway protein [Candidatus Brocadiaceae bacterium]